MDSKPLAFVALAFLVAPSIVCAKDADPHVQYSAAEYLRNFALSVCIADGYKSEEVVKDGRAAAGGYLEFGSSPIEAYEDVEALGKTFLAKDYPSIHGGQITLMKCIDFYHSKELERVVKKYQKR
jgi:hypothetical protein